MPSLETLFDDIEQYYSDVNSLVVKLKENGVTTYEQFLEQKKEFQVPVPRSVLEQIKLKFENSDNDDWEHARLLDTEEAYKDYLLKHKQGSHREEARSAIEAINNRAAQNASEQIWEQIDKDDIQQLQEFVNNYPDSPFYQTALDTLNTLRITEFIGMNMAALVDRVRAIETDKNVIDKDSEIFKEVRSFLQKKYITKDELMDKIEEDHNFLSAGVINMLWRAQDITDFSRLGVDKDFITEMMRNSPRIKFSTPKSITEVSKIPSTEVYFWGIPSSGKSCAIGAILSAANNGKTALSMPKDNGCQGYHYMNCLSDLFQNDGTIGILPEGTPTKATYEMAFDLEDLNHKMHPITCIDLAGELVKCMYKSDADLTLQVDEQEALDTMTNVLVKNKTGNRKIHFFVIEYGAEKKKYEGLPQRTYLDGAVAYLETTEIFKKDTDAIYLLITKTDKAKKKGRELQEELEAHINSNYLQFLNGLKRICKVNEINDGNVDIIPFTLGEVCFQNYCKFKEKTAAYVVQKILERSYGYKPDKLNKMLGRLKK